MAAGTLFTIGMGPGDPELMTLKAVRIIGAAPVVAYFAKRGRTGHARSIAGGHVAAGAIELRFEYPYTTEIAVDDPRYIAELGTFYERSAAEIADIVAGHTVSIRICAASAIVRPVAKGVSPARPSRTTSYTPSRPTSAIGAGNGCAQPLPQPET